MHLRSLGAEVTIAARDEATLRASAADLGVNWVQADVSTPEGVQAAVHAAGRVDILVSNAGGPPPALPSGVTEDAWERGFQTTFLSTARLAGAALPGMRERGWGRIITDFDSGLWSFETIKPGPVPGRRSRTRVSRSPSPTRSWT